MDAWIAHEIQQTDTVNIVEAMFGTFYVKFPGVSSSRRHCHQTPSVNQNSAFIPKPKTAVVLKGHAHNFFELEDNNPYVLFVQR